MRSLLARLAVLGAFAMTMSACTNGSGTSLPFAGPPNNAGGVPGTVQAGSNGTALMRFVQGSPDYGTVDICIDNLAFGITTPSVAYGKASTSLYAIAGGITHTLALYPGIATAGAECPTAPGPYLGVAPIRITTLTVGNNVRWTMVLGGTAASGTLGVYIYGEPAFSAAPAGPEVISHNVAPAFSVGKAAGVGFGQCTTTATPCATAVALTGASGVAVAKSSSPLTSTVNATVISAITGPPTGFYDGIGLAAGAPVPITSIAAPTPVAGQPYVVQLYAIDGPAGGLNLVGLVEQSLGFGF